MIFNERSSFKLTGATGPDGNFIETPIITRKSALRLMGSTGPSRSSLTGRGSSGLGLLGLGGLGGGGSSKNKTPVKKKRKAAATAGTRLMVVDEGNE
jgi:hypothetical protein